MPFFPLFRLFCAKSEGIFLLVCQNFCCFKKLEQFVRAVFDFFVKNFQKIRKVRIVFAKKNSGGRI